MTSHFRSKSPFRITGISLAAISGVVLMACLFSFRAKADEWDKTTLLTLSEPTQVMNTYLEPGTYMFKLANTDRHIVQIFNRDRSHLINTIIAVPSYRVKVTDRPTFTFWETPPGTAKALRTWYYPDDNYGQEFTYPTQLRQIAAVTTPSLPAPAPPPAEPQVSAPPAAVAPAPEPQAEVAPAPAPQEPVEIAQNNPPPAPPPAVAQEPAQSQSQAQPQSSDSDLPKTASPYPLIGLGGLLSLALFLGLRLKQSR